MVVRAGALGLPRGAGIVVGGTNDVVVDERGGALEPGAAVVLVAPADEQPATTRANNVVAIAAAVSSRRRRPAGCFERGSFERRLTTGEKLVPGARFAGLAPGSRGVERRYPRTPRAQRAFGADQEHELYDLGEDPGELVNLAADPARIAQVRERFATLLEYESPELAAPPD